MLYHSKARLMDNGYCCRHDCVLVLLHELLDTDVSLKPLYQHINQCLYLKGLAVDFVFAVHLSSSGNDRMYIA